VIFLLLFLQDKLLNKLDEHEPEIAINQDEEVSPNVVFISIESISMSFSTFTVRTSRFLLHVK